MQRIILHIDFDYFYAQVEETVRPNAKNKPIVVCMFSGRTAESGAVATCNYLARKFGVKAGIPIINAKRMLKDIEALFLPANHQLYAETSYKAMEILEQFADKFEPASIDEAFLDVTKKTNSNFAKVKALAKEIKKEIKKKLNLTCSIGVAPNKLVAKIASDFQKPDGLTIVKPEEVDSFLGYLDVDKIPGIGKKTKEYLETLSVKTVSDLKNHDPTDIVEKFGKNIGSWLVRAARGEDDSEVGIIQDQKQISRISTLKRNSRDFEEFVGDIDYLINDVVSELKDRDLLCETVGIIAIDEELQTISRSRTLQRPTNNLDEIKRIVHGLYKELLSQIAKDIRRIGVKVEKLQSKAGQKTLGEF